MWSIQKPSLRIIVAAAGVALFALTVPQGPFASSFANASAPGQSFTTDSHVLDTIHFLRQTSFGSLVPSLPPHRGTVLNVTLGEDCGGGTQTTEGIGPVVSGVTSCSACQTIAKCIGNKTGKSDPAYLWDSETKVCGVGIEADKTIVNSCGAGDACLGVSKADFAKVKDDAVNLALNAEALFPQNFARAELLLAYTYAASKWNQFAGEGKYPDDFSCAVEKAAFEGPAMCGQAALDAATKTMDVNGDGVPDNKSCLAMPVSKDADGAAGPLCGGRIGISQVLPSIYEKNVFLITTLGGFNNPWEQRGGLAVAESLLSLNASLFDGSACTTSCVASGRSIDTCLAECAVKQERCAIIDSYYGEGACTNPSPEQKTFADTVLQFKPVMKSLLTTGICPGEDFRQCQDLPDGDVGGIDIARFNELRALVDEMVPKVKALYGYVVRPEYVLSVMKIESGWNPALNPALRYYYTHSPFTEGILRGQTAAFLEICADPKTRAEVESKYGAAFGKCEDMPVSSAGAMGIAQAMPTTWKGVLNQTQNLKSLTGDDYDNPWNDRHAVAFATYFLGQKVDGCGDEEKASGAYWSVGCTAPNDHYEKVKLVLPIIEDLYAQACTVPAGDGCPLVMPPFPPTPPTTGCLQLTSDFCPSDPSQCFCYIAGKIHRGVDILGIRGEQIYAPFDGKITNVIAGCVEGDATCGDTWGNHLVLKQNGTDFHALYAHLMDIIVLQGESVTKGRVLGHVNNTGWSDGDHLHFETSPGGNPKFGAALQDPRSFFSCIPKEPSCKDSTKDEFCPVSGETK